MTWAAAGFALSAIGLGLGVMSGRKQDRYSEMLVEKQYQADLANWKYNWQEAEDAYTYQMEDIDIAKFNFDQTRKYRNETAIADWIDKDKQRIFDYNQQVKAYNASVEAYGTQLDYIDVAHELSAESADRAYQEKLIQVGFQYEALKTTAGRKETDIRLKRKGITSDFKAAKRTAKLDKDQIKAAFAASSAEMKAKIEQQEMLGYTQIGQVRALGQAGNSAKRNAVAARLGMLRLTNAMIDAEDRAYQTRGLDLKKIDAKLESLGDKLDLQDQELINDLFNTRVDTEFGEAQLAETVKSTNLQTEADRQKLKLHTFAEQIRARDMLAPTPVLAPQLSKPLEMPEPVLQKPKKPRKGPKPRKGAAMTGHGLAGLAGGLQSMASAAAAFA